MSMTVIEHIEVGSGGAASITFSSIPQTYTDLLIVTSLRTQQGGLAFEVFLSFNGSTTGFSARQLYGDGSTAASSTPARQAGILPGTATTSSTYNSGQLYIPNYASSNAKSYSLDSVTENNGTTAYQNILAGLWSGTAAISSLTLTNTGANNFVQYSSATLYGITAGSDGTTTVS